jgi:hypothetical protein
VQAGMTLRGTSYVVVAIGRRTYDVRPGCEATSEATSEVNDIGGD